MSREVLSMLSPILTQFLQASSVSRMRKPMCLQSLHVGFYQVKQFWRWHPVAVFHLPMIFLGNLMCLRSLDIVRVRTASSKQNFLGQLFRPLIDPVIKAFASAQLLPIHCSHRLLNLMSLPSSEFVILLFNLLIFPCCKIMTEHISEIHHLLRQLRLLVHTGGDRGQTLQVMLSKKQSLEKTCRGTCTS